MIATMELLIAEIGRAPVEVGSFFNSVGRFILINLYSFKYNMVYIQGG